MKTNDIDSQIGNTHEVSSVVTEVVAMGKGRRLLALLTLRSLPVIVLPLILCVASGAALAADGVIEINQAKALARGGYRFLFRISLSGSYRLTSNLVVPDANTSGIIVDANDVTIDLNGFSIIGPGTSGLGSGINASDLQLVTIYNGEVAGMGNNGIAVGQNSRIERVRLLNNRADGIYAGTHCEISHNISNNNGLNGIDLQPGEGIISSNVTQFNGNDGIFAGAYSVLVDNTANHNGGNGIEVEGGNSMRGNAAANNHVAGLYCFFAVSGYAHNVFASNPANVGHASNASCVNLGHNLCDGTACP